MNKTLPNILVLIAGLFLVLVTVAHIFSPGEAQAKPLAGFTPTPVPPDSGDDGGDPGDDGDDGDDDSTPTDFVIIQIDQCNLSCSAQLTDPGDSTQLQALASVAGDAAQAPLLSSAAPELLAPVQLIHQGSGFIVEGTLSNQHSTRFSLPYPGQWQVVLVAPPQFAAGESLNLASLEPSAALGLVEANVLTPQRVKCPLNCTVDPPPAVPETLPTTGAGYNTMLLTIVVLLFAGVNLLIVGITFWLPPPEK
jgi:hypothetical protein